MCLGLWFQSTIPVPSHGMRVNFVNIYKLGLYQSDETIIHPYNIVAIVVGLVVSYLTIDQYFTEKAITYYSDVGLQDNWMHWKGN